MPSVTFDLWHTLLYLSPAEEDAYMAGQAAAAARVLAGSARRPGAPDLAERELGELYETSLARAVAAAHEGRTVTPAAQLVEAAEAAGREPRPEEFVEELDRLVRRTRFRVAEGAVELLGNLHSRGYRLALISNTIGEPGASLRPVLREKGIGRHFSELVFSDEHPWAKPAPEIFHLALGARGNRPSDAVHVGDGWSDIEGARRARFRGAVLFTGLGAYGARYRELFASSPWDRDGVRHRAATLAEVGVQVETILPAPTGR